MNYWPRWINAIKKRTAALSLAQMGAYDRLLDHYYAEEQPLPGTLDECCRIAGAINRDEREAVRFVLTKFFDLKDGAYTNERADEEIQLALPKIAAARSNGAKGGRRKGTGKKPTGLPDGIPDRFLPGKPAQSDGDTTGQAPHPHSNNSEARAHPARALVAESVPETEEPTGAAPTPEGAVCRAMKAAGFKTPNPGDARLKALLAQGVTQDELVGVAKEASDKGKSWAWLLTVVENRRHDAAAIDVPATQAAPAKPWHESADGIKAKGLELGMPWSEDGWVNGENMAFPTYKARVMARSAVGGSP